MTDDGKLSTREVAERIGVNVSRVRWWLANDLIVDAPGFEGVTKRPGANGDETRWPPSVLDRLRTAARVSDAIAAGEKHAGASYRLLRLVLDNYDDGFVMLDGGVTLEWDGGDT